MSEHDEAEAESQRRRRRRSLRVPVDAVPRARETEVAGSQESPSDVDEERKTLPDLEAVSQAQGVSVEPEEQLVAEAEPNASLDPDRTDSSPAPSMTGTIGGAAEAETPSVEGQVGEGAEETKPEPAAEPPRPSRSVGVIVQRVVGVASSRATPPPPEEPPAETEAVDEFSVEIDEEPELHLSEADPAELDELEVDLEESSHESDLPLEAADLESEPTELALEDAEALLEEEDVGELPVQRTSLPPPPPPSKTKEAPSVEPPATPPPPPESAAAVAPPPVAKKKRARRAWWEELFNDDYLRTVPIPHPRVIERQCDFIEQRFGLAPGATLLDVGCGLGLHAVELTRRGYTVVGLDLSPSMLARARAEAEDHGVKVNFLQADMREMTFDGVFDAILCYGTTFGYFDDEANKQLVERLHRALKPRGLLLLDVANRDFVIRNQPNLVWFEGDGCVVMEESQMNYITSRLEVKRTVILDDGRQRENIYSIRTYSLHELGQLLHHQGFRVVEVTGWEAHPGVFFGGDSPKLIILAERRPQGPPTPPARPPSTEAASSNEPAPPAPPEEPSAESAKPDPQKEPSEAVTDALAEALEQSTELELEPESEADEEDAIHPDELTEEEPDEPKS